MRTGILFVLALIPLYAGAIALGLVLTSPEVHTWLRGIRRRLRSTRSTRAHRLPQAWNENEQGLLVIEGYRADPPWMTPKDSPPPPTPAILVDSDVEPTSEPTPGPTTPEVVRYEAATVEGRRLREEALARALWPEPSCMVCGVRLSKFEVERDGRCLHCIRRRQRLRERRHTETFPIFTYERVDPEDYPEITPPNTLYCSARPPEDPEPGALWRPMSPDGVRGHTLRRWDGTAWIALEEGA